MKLLSMFEMNMNIIIYLFNFYVFLKEKIFGIIIDLCFYMQTIHVSLSLCAAFYSSQKVGVSNRVSGKVL